MRPIKVKILFWVLLWPSGWIVNALMGEILATAWNFVLGKVTDDKSFPHLVFNLWILEIYEIRCFHPTSCYQKGSTEDFLFFPDDLKHICTKKSNRLMAQFIFHSVVCITILHCAQCNFICEKYFQRKIAAHLSFLQHIWHNEQWTFWNVVKQAHCRHMLWVKCYQSWVSYIAISIFFSFWVGGEWVGGGGSQKFTL